ncbi:hypothetical protein [Corynebacterium sphenisci]|uniref:hypothetical protein n=1 Tax=Corynebacterium sphenisci TaxID=191493 RepID=UPI0026E03E68|nr:hypothetical protein [Corynebacterium sphenisci]MDO5731721.1 hypothetical protein [Corynebacterium sphenisci]
MNERWTNPDQPGDPARPPESPATGPGPGPAGGAGDTRMLPQQPPGPAQWATGAGSPAQGHGAPEAGHPGAPWPPAGAVPGAGDWAGAAPADRAGSGKTRLRRVLFGLGFVLVLVLATGGAYLYGAGRFPGSDPVAAGTTSESASEAADAGDSSEAPGRGIGDYVRDVVDGSSESTDATGFYLTDDNGVSVHCAFGGDFGFGACSTIHDYWDFIDGDAYSLHLASGDPVWDSDLSVTDMDVWKAATEDLETHTRVLLPDDDGWVYYDGWFLMRGGIEIDGDHPVIVVSPNSRRIVWDY